MNILDCIEVWLGSCSELLDSGDVVVRFLRSDSERLNPSCAVNLVRGVTETDLLVWESGEAELALVAADGTVVEEHIEGLLELDKLVEVLQRALRGFFPS